MPRAAVHLTARSAAVAAVLLTLVAVPRHGWAQG